MKLRNIRGTIPGTTDAEINGNITRYILYLINGYSMNHNGKTKDQWTDKKGTLLAQVEKESLSVESSTLLKNMKRNFKNITIETEYLKDYEYFIHCMQKPAFEVPNPVILGTFLGELAAPQSVGTDAEGSEILDRNRQHDFAYQLVHYYDDDSDFPIQKAAMKKLIQGLFRKYQEGTGYLWTSTNKTPAATYMQNSTTEIPSLAYHGNLVIDRQNIGREEVRCVGHLGNSFPGCSCIRQGKGMLNLYERPPTAIHVI